MIGGIPPSIAQDMGDVAKFGVSYAAAEVVTRGAARGFTAVKAGAKVAGTEGLLAAFEGAGSGSAPLLRTQAGGIKIGAAVEVSETATASSKLTPILQALGLESGPKTLTLLEQKLASGEWRIVDGRTIRKGQEWKLKVHGTGQNTGTPGHGAASRREAVRFAQETGGDPQAIYMDRGIRGILRDMGVDPATVDLPRNFRPDMTGVNKGARHIKLVEVMSKTDKQAKLEAKLEMIEDALKPHGITMDGEVRRITGFDYEKGKPKQ